MDHFGPFIMALVVSMIHNSDICFCVQLLQPTDITRHEGADNVIIPCPTDHNLPPIWSINGSYYSIYNLPAMFQPSLIGIIIPFVQKEMNNTSFQCYYSTGNGLQFVGSSIGTLTVLRYNTTENLGNTGGFQDDCLYLNHAETNFGEDTLTIAVKNSNSDCDTFQLVSKDRCTNDSRVVEPWQFSETTVSINSTSTQVNSGHLVNFYVYGMDNDSICSQVTNSFQVFNSATIEELQVSPSRSKDMNFNATLPQLILLIPTGSSGSQDCICPLIFQENAICSNLSRCQCIEDTNFTPSMIDICNRENSQVNFSFRNLSVEVNNTKLFFFHEVCCETSSSCTQDLYRAYVKSFEISQVLPEIPIVNIDDEIGEICILSPEADTIPADEYQISVYDISGGATFETVLYSDNCSLVNSLFQPPECAPFTVSVKAINSAGFSDINHTILIDEERSNLCECINKQVSVDLLVTKEVEQIKVNLICQRNEYSSEIMTKIEIDDLMHTSRLISCKMDEEFDNLNCSRSYNISVYWRSSTNASQACLYFSIPGIMPLCPKIPPGKNNDRLPLILGLSLGLPLSICIPLVLIYFTFKIILNRLRKRQKQRHEHHTETGANMGKEDVSYRPLPNDLNISTNKGFTNTV